MDENKSDDKKESGHKEVYDYDNNNTFHGKLSNNSAQFHLNYETETDTSFGSDTKTTEENKFIDNEIVTFNNNNVKWLHILISTKGDQVCVRSYFNIWYKDFWYEENLECASTSRKVKIHNMCAIKEIGD